MECPTVRMKCEPTPENPAGFVVINAIDYRPEDGMITVEEFEARVSAARTAGAPAVAVVPPGEPQAPGSPDAPGSAPDGQPGANVEDVSAKEAQAPADSESGKVESAKKAKKDK